MRNMVPCKNPSVCGTKSHVQGTAAARSCGARREPVSKRWTANPPAMPPSPSSGKLTIKGVKKVRATGTGVGSAVRRNEDLVKRTFPGATVEYMRDDAVAIRPPSENGRTFILSGDRAGGNYRVWAEEVIEDQSGDAVYERNELIGGVGTYRPGDDDGMERMLEHLKKPTGKIVKDEEAAYPDEIDLSSKE